MDPRIDGVEEVVLPQADLEQLDDGTTIHTQSKLNLLGDVRLETSDRGHGRSDKPHDPDAYALRTRVMDVEAVLDELGMPESA